MGKTYCGVGTIPKNSKRGTMKECAEAGQIRYYGIKKIDSKLVEHGKESKKKTATLNTILMQKAKMMGKINALKKKHKTEKDTKEKDNLKDEYKKLVQEVKKVNAKLKKLSRTQSRQRKVEKKNSKKLNSKGSKKKKPSSKKSKKSKKKKSSSKKPSSKKPSRTPSRKGKKSSTKVKSKKPKKKSNKRTKSQTSRLRSRKRDLSCLKKK